MPWFKVKVAPLDEPGRAAVKMYLGKALLAAVIVPKDSAENLAFQLRRAYKLGCQHGKQQLLSRFL